MFAKLVGSLLPKQLDDEFPARITIVTGVLRAGETYVERAPQIPPAAVAAIAPVADDSNNDD